MPNCCYAGVIFFISLCHIQYVYEVKWMHKSVESNSWVERGMRSLAGQGLFDDGIGEAAHDGARPKRRCPLAGSPSTHQRAVDDCGYMLP